ncbi:MAG: hypothetical protein KAQ96_01970 [Thermoplasmata archaeon]|nr:hypothetical protein [Thermoplasmata archaeon]
MLKVIASAVILAILGILFILYNQHDGRMMGFGWFLVAVGAIIAGVFSYLLYKAAGAEPEPTPEAKGRQKRNR